LAESRKMLMGTRSKDSHYNELDYVLRM
jgi:hypothetical protein